MIQKGASLDVCCGSGNNAVYLARKGFDCYGIDISWTAIGYAREKIAAEGRKCELLKGNVLELPYPDSTFTLVFDRVCFHSQHPAERKTYVAGIFRVIKPSGKYLLLCFIPGTMTTVRPTAFRLKISGFISTPYLRFTV